MIGASCATLPFRLLTMTSNFILLNSSIHAYSFWASSLSFPSESQIVLSSYISFVSLFLVLSPPHLLYSFPTSYHTFLIHHPLVLVILYVLQIMSYFGIIDISLVPLILMYQLDPHQSISRSIPVIITTFIVSSPSHLVQNEDPLQDSRWRSFLSIISSNFFNPFIQLHVLYLVYMNNTILTFIIRVSYFYSM